jgi:Transposase DNA-binding/Transposase Tn5 dimerisation domain
MTTPLRLANALKWSKKNFSGMFSTDERRTKRVINFAARMKDAPGKSIPQLWENTYDIKATYNLLKHPESHPDYLQRGHRNLVKNEISKPGTYLIIEDDSELSWSGKDPIEGLGPVGDFRNGLQGFMMHTAMATRWKDSEEFDDRKRPPLQILGIADQQFFLRKKGVKKSQRRQGAPAPGTFKETDPWFHSMTRIGPKPEDAEVKWIRICDRRADIFEQFEESTRLGYDFIIRNAQDRALEDCLEETKTLSAFVQDMPILGQLEVKLRSRNGIKARTACVNVYAGTVTFRPPFRKGISRLQQKPYTCQVVYVKEIGELSKNVEPIEWVLLTSLSVHDFNAARAVVRKYTCRWLIEEFHKALKSGLKAEELELEHADRLFATISIMSVVAISLVELREMVRVCPEAPAEESNLSRFEITVLEKRLERKIKAVKDVVLAIGRLGGHMNRKGDGLPGLVTLWRGWTELKILCEGARLFADEKLFT